MRDGETDRVTESCFEFEATLFGSLAAAVRPGVPGGVTRFRTQKTAALFAFLAYRAGAPQSRESLIARFWPDSGLDPGRMSLRTALAALRKDFGEALSTDKMTVTLHVATDVQRFERALREARQPALGERERIERLRGAVDACGGPLLPGFYDDWIFPERDRLAAERLAALGALSRWHESLGELPQAAAFARRACVADPLSESLRGELIRLLKAGGQRAEARRQFEDIERLLADALGNSPSPELRALVADIDADARESHAAGRRAVVLPIVRGRFRSRREPLAALVQRLSGGKGDGDGIRLFTLFGPGGIGKTRLAIEAARRLTAHGVVGEVRFVALADAATAAQLWDAVFSALELTRTSDAAPAAQVAARLEPSGSCLLILDNLEQIALEAGEAAAALLAAAPGLTILATSRRRLGTPDEELIAVGALDGDEGIALFVDRARAVAPGFDPTDAERATLRTLVARLEGSPLAIELAAAWASALTPAEMLTQLDDGPLALPERAGGEERHSSLSAAIRWSVALLGPDLRRAFFALSVFRGGWLASASEAVCGVGRDALAGLRDRSLLSAQARGDALRFEMHEALRAYGQAALPPEERAPLESRFVDWFLRLAESGAEPARIAEEKANFQRALERADPARRVRLCLALAPLWESQGRWQDGRLWLEAALTCEMEESGRAWLLHYLGRLRYQLCDYPAALKAHQEALPLFEALSEAVGIGKSCQALAAIAFHHRSDLDRVEALTERALAQFEAADHAAGQASALAGLGAVATARGDRKAARTLHQRSLDVASTSGATAEMAFAHHRLGSTAIHLDALESAERHLLCAERLYRYLESPGGAAHVLLDLGVLAYYRDRPGEARVRYESALAALREHGDPWGASICLGNLARLAAEEGESGQAARLWGESLDIRTALGDTLLVLYSLEGIAHLLACRARGIGSKEAAEGAVRLRAAGLALREKLGAGPLDPDPDAPSAALLRDILGEARFVRAEAEGTDFTEERAVEIARAALETCR